MVLGLRLGGSFPEELPGFLLITFTFKSHMDNLKSLEVGNDRLELAQFEGLGDAAGVVGVINMTGEDLSFPCLSHQKKD